MRECGTASGGFCFPRPCPFPFPHLPIPSFPHHGTVTCRTIVLVSPLASVTVSDTQYVPADAHVLRVVEPVFVSLRPLPQSHL